MDGYGAAAVPPLPMQSAPGQQYPLLISPTGVAINDGRSYYAQPSYFTQQVGSRWAMTGSFSPAWANPWGYDYGELTPSTIFPLVATNLPAGGLDPKTGQAQQQGVSPLSVATLFELSATQFGG